MISAVVMCHQCAMRSRDITDRRPLVFSLFLSFIRCFWRLNWKHSTDEFVRLSLFARRNIEETFSLPPSSSSSSCSSSSSSSSSSKIFLCIHLFGMHTNATVLTESIQSCRYLDIVFFFLLLLITSVDGRLHCFHSCSVVSCCILEN